MPVRAPAGSALIWRPTTLHAVQPHRHPDEPRKALHVSYGPRWVRQSIPHRPDGHVAQSEEMLIAAAAHSPVRQQLFQGFCGEMDAVSNLRGSGNRGQTSNSGGSQFWFTDDWATVPLKAWAEDRLMAKSTGAAESKDQRHLITPDPFK